MHVQQLAEHRGRQLVERTSARNAKDRPVLAGPRWREYGRIVLLLVGFDTRSLPALAGGRVGDFIPVGGQLLDQFTHGSVDANDVLFVERTARVVYLRQQQPRQHDFIVISRQGTALEHLFGLVDGFVGVPGEYALVEALGGTQRRRVSNQNIEKLQPFDMPPEDAETNRQRGRKQKTHWSPQPGPKGGRNDHRDRREAGAVPVHHRLDYLADQRFDDN